MSYADALEAAGAHVIAYERFGDWQGTWIAVVDYKGELGIVDGSYGSCSGCDAFASEFGYDEEKPDYRERLARFGQTYLDNFTSDVAEVRRQYVGDTSWDYDAKAIVEWLDKRFPTDA